MKTLLLLLHIWNPATGVTTEQWQTSYTMPGRLPSGDWVAGTPMTQGMDTCKAWAQKAVYLLQLQGYLPGSDETIVIDKAECSEEL